jgi:hypothetical protein
MIIGFAKNIRAIGGSAQSYTLTEDDSDLSYVNEQMDRESACILESLTSLVESLSHLSNNESFNQPANIIAWDTTLNLVISDKKSSSVSLG